MKSFLVAVALIGGSVGSAACADDGAHDGKLRVAVAFYPIEEIVRRIGGADVDVITLVPRGGEAHEYEPTARQVARLEDADIVFYLGSNFQPGLQQVIDALPNSVQRIDLLDGLTLLHDDDGIDPHVWLDPTNMRAMATDVLNGLSENLPPNSSVQANFTAYDQDLDSLHDDFAAQLSHCDVPVLISTHHAFAYLAGAFGLTYRAIAGVSPGDEPSAQSLEDLAEFAAQNDVTTIYYEQNLPADLATTVASEIDGDTAPLATAESLTEDELDGGASYVSLMRGNLQALRIGMDCT